MARILGEPRHTLAIQDPVSGSVVTLHYRGPTSEERVAYQLSAFRFEGGERRFCLGETRLKFGLEILAGFGAGDFIPWGETIVVHGGFPGLTVQSALAQARRLCHRFDGDLR